MDNIDYSVAKEELERLFAEPSDHRKIVFWFDAPKNFIADVTADKDNFQNAKVVIFEGNPFTIKVRLEVEEPESNFLIYCPMERPADSENWLEDSLLMAKEYYADTVALTMRRLGLSSAGLRNVVERHIHFFDAQDRISQLQKRIELNDSTSPKDLEYAMMSVLVKNADYYNKIDYILRELILDDGDGPKYGLLEKYGFRDFLWNVIGEAYSYSGEETISRLADSFLVTAIAKKADFAFDVPYLKNLVMNDNSEDAEIFVSSVLMADERYVDFASGVCKRLRVIEMFASKGIEAIGSCDVFPEFDEMVISAIVHALAGGSYDYDFYARIIQEQRRSGKWFERFRNEYGFILDFIDFRKRMTLSIPEGLLAEEYIARYVETYHLVDRAYRHLLCSYAKIEDPSDEELSIVETADNEYETKFLNPLGYAFSNSLKAKEPNYSFGSFPLSVNFYKNHLDRNVKKQFVIISDAMRFEVGRDLVESINKMESFKGKAKILAQVTTLPSITMFGMASLLPHQEISYADKAVFADGKPTDGLDARRKVLLAKSKGYDAIRYDTVMGWNKTALRDYMKDKSVVYIYHDTIDAAGEHDVGVVEACERAVNEITQLIKKLYNALMISNYIITSDHGFLYRNKKIDESAKYGSIASLGIDFRSGRFAVLEHGEEIANTNRFDMSYLGACDHKVATPYGCDLFPKAGGGIQYIHGGSSLQEIVTPIIVLSEMRAAKEEAGAEPVKVMLKTPTRKIMTKSFSLTFEQMERVEGRKTEAVIRVYFVDEDDQVISDEKTFVANKTSENDREISMRFLLKNLDYDRNKRYFLVIKNDEEDEIGERVQFVIDLAKFKPIF